jgi:8-oxo-dGTP pyrophosphatase MutT (NUDIX family)
METLVINPNNLKDEEIYKTVIRVKAFVVNDHGEILLEKDSEGMIQLPGGHLEDNEIIEEGLIREVAEETGILVSKEEVSAPFFQIKNYVYDDSNMGKHKLAKMIYFLVKTNKQPDTNVINLTELELSYKLSTIYVHKDEFVDFLKTSTAGKKRLIQVIAEEMLNAYEQLKKIL